MQYRQDIQLLRAIAVILVVLFHFGVPGFKSGFLGVDVFFVISGYLMAKMYDPERKKDFYFKRASRLLPAYFVVVILTVLTAIAVTNPIDFKQVSTQAGFAIIFASNVGFWMENSYFDKAAFKPLLHLWSLGVEMQFYLLIPLLSWVFGKIKYGFLIITIVSAVLCFVMVGISPKTSFFWLPLRLWEFLMGFGVATYIYEKEDRWRSWLGFGGLVSVVCLPLFNIDGRSNNFISGHPGVFALLISLATAAVLSFSLPPAILASSVSKLAEKIGNYSYSIYLAHFPIIVFYFYEPFSGTVLSNRGIAHSAILLILVVIFSAMLFSLIEKPGRRMIRSPFRWAIPAALIVVATSYFGSIIQRSKTPSVEMLIYEAWEDRDIYRCGKIVRVIDPFAISCEITVGLNNPSRRVIFVGNSHADSIKAAFRAVAEERNVALYFLVENAPLMKIGKTTPQMLIDEALSRSADLIVLHYAPETVDVKAIAELAQLANYHQLGLSFIMPVPIWDQNVPMALLSNFQSGKPLPIQTKGEYLSSNKRLSDELAAITYQRLLIYRVDDILCGHSTADRCSLIAKNGRPLYFDKDHLTLTGGALLEGVFKQILSDRY